MELSLHIPFLIPGVPTPTVKPPPPAEDSSISDAKAVSLDDTVHELRDLLFSIALPKTEKAKTAAVTVGALCRA